MYDAPFMLPIAEKYKELGTIVVGKAESGSIRRGDTVTIMPNRVFTIFPWWSITDSIFYRGDVKC